MRGFSYIFSSRFNHTLFLILDYARTSAMVAIRKAVAQATSRHARGRRSGHSARGAIGVPSGTRDGDHPSASSGSPMSEALGPSRMAEGQGFGSSRPPRLYSGGSLTINFSSLSVFFRVPRLVTPFLARDILCRSKSGRSSRKGSGDHERGRAGRVEWRRGRVQNPTQRGFSEPFRGVETDGVRRVGRRSIRRNPGGSGGGELDRIGQYFERVNRTIRTVLGGSEWHK